jgi:hypothetical protein
MVFHFEFKRNAQLLVARSRAMPLENPKSKPTKMMQNVSNVQEALRNYRPNLIITRCRFKFLTYGSDGRPPICERPEVTTMYM